MVRLVGDAESVQGPILLEAAESLGTKRGVQVADSPSKDDVTVPY